MQNVLVFLKPGFAVGQILLSHTNIHFVNTNVLNQRQKKMFRQSFSFFKSGT